MAKKGEFPDQPDDDSPKHLPEVPDCPVEVKEPSNDDSMGMRFANLLNVSVCRQSYGYYSVFRFDVDLYIELGWHSTTVELYEMVGGVRTWVASMTRGLIEPMPPPDMRRRERWSATTFANNSGANRSFEVDAFLYRFQDQTVSKGITAGPNTAPCPA